MYIPRLRRVRLTYSQLEIATQLKAIGELKAQLNEATPDEVPVIQNQLDISRLTLTHMMERNKKILKREV